MCRPVRRRDTMTLSNAGFRRDTEALEASEKKKEHQTLVGHIQSPYTS